MAPSLPPASLKLTYFDIKGRAEPIRMALFIGDIDFMDDRVAFSDFPTLKPQLPFGQLPVLKIDNSIVLTQSLAIARYSARLADLYPEDLLQAAKVDECMGAVDDLSAEISKSLFIEDKEKKAEMRNDLTNNFLPRWLIYIEKLLGPDRLGYCVGDSLTIADLYLYTKIEYLKSGVLQLVPTDLYQQNDRVYSYFSFISSDAKVLEYLALQQYQTTITT